MLTLQDRLTLALSTFTPDFLDFGLPMRDRLLPATLLRDYQLDLLLRVLHLMRLGYRRILIQLATGGGKTVIAAALLGSVAALGLNGDFIVHRKELLRQTSKSFDYFGLTHGFVAAGQPMDLDNQVLLAGVQTLANRLGLLLPPNLAVIDEAHHASAGTWAKVLEAYGDAFIIGLTGTPQRLDGQGLYEHFDVIVQGPTPAWLIANGYLSAYEYFAPTIPDMAGVPDVGGDFNRKAVAERVDKPKLIGDIVEHYLRLAPGEQGIVFAVNREHSRRLADAFGANGVPAMHVDGAMSEKERERFDDAFRAGDIRVGCNVALFSEGYDVPNIAYVGMGAPTKSLVKHLQDCGRGLRIFPGKRIAKLADHAGNAVARNLGLPDDDRDWSLEGRPKGKRGTPDDATPITQCKTCFRVYPSVMRFCPGCEEETPAQPRIIQEVAGKLSKLEREEMKKRAAAKRKEEERACETWDEFVSLGRARNYEFPRQWATRMCKLRRIPATTSRI